MLGEKLKIILVLSNQALCSMFIDIDIDEVQTEPVVEAEPFMMELPFR